ncbi:MAG: hypothetical protein WC314_21930 [Vulcanimicrobiota bacterium]
MLTQNFGAAASFQAFGAASFGVQPQGAQFCQCATPPQPYPTFPSYPQQPQVGAQFQMQMMMGYFMSMMASMTQLQQGFGSYLGQSPQIANPYQGQPTGGGYGSGYAAGGYNGGGGYTPAPTPAPKPAPAPAPPAKKGGYA